MWILRRRMGCRRRNTEQGRDRESLLRFDVALSTEQQSIALARQGGAEYISKIIFSEVPTSSNCILVALTIHLNQKMALYRVGCPDGGWSTH
jgi:hypothetical protein